MDETLSFYVTVRSGDRAGFLLGPYPTHEEALRNVARGKTLANEANCWAHFYAFGTASASKAIKTVFGD